MAIAFSVHAHVDLNLFVSVFFLRPYPPRFSAPRGQVFAGCIRPHLAQLISLLIEVVAGGKPATGSEGEQGERADSPLAIDSLIYLITGQSVISCKDLEIIAEPST